MLCILSNSDIIQIVSTVVLIITAVILFFTLSAMRTSNEENARLNRLQAAENTIMKQIEFHNSMLKGINVNIALMGRGFGTPDAPVTAYGQDAFEIFYDRLKEIFSTMPGNTYKGPTDAEAEERRICDAFTQLYSEHGSQLGNYFKNLYLLIDYIENVKISGFQEKYFIELVKAQLSKYEILLLAYDCIWIQDKRPGKRFIDFAKKHKLLSALETEALIRSVSSVHHEDIFKDHYGIEFKKPREFTN